MQKRLFPFLTAGLLSAVLLFGCKDDNNNPKPVVNVPSVLTINKAGFIPEDVLVYKNNVYVSGLGDGSIHKFDLTKTIQASEEILSAEEDLPSRWGMAVDESRQTLLNITNISYAFNGEVSRPAKVNAYKLGDHSKVASWTLPEGTVGNGILVANGFYYISDIGPHTRIIRLNPQTGEILIKTDALWPSSGFGFGNIIYMNGGLYGAVNQKMWFVPLDSRGDFGQVSEVTGLTNTFSDGMSKASNNVFYYAENDALDPENKGKIWKVSLTSPNAATASLATGINNNGSLNNPSGVFITTINEKNYLFVNESQLLNPDLVLPFKIMIYPL
jgi:hypothetical protein